MWNWFSSAPSYCEHLDQGDGTNQFFELNGSEGGSPLNESNHQALSQCQFGTNAACKSINWTNQLDFRTREKMVAKNMNINQQRNHNRRGAINNICNLILYEWSKWCLKWTRRRETKEYFVLYTNKHISWSCFNSMQYSDHASCCRCEHITTNSFFFSTLELSGKKTWYWNDYTFIQEI